MRHFYLLFRVFTALCLSVVIVSCNESTVDPEFFGSISGTVVSSETEGSLPLEGVTITTNPGTTSVVTNSEGGFALNKVLVGDYSVNAKKEDYTSVNTSITIREGQENIIQIVMEVAPPETVAPDETVYATPLDATGDLQTELSLVWKNGVTENGDTLFFDVILFEDGVFEGDTIAKGINDTTVIATNLKFETNYRWKVDASNRARYKTEGREWKFRTEDFPKNGYLFVKDTLGSKDVYSWDLAENHLIRLTSDGGSDVNPRIAPNEELIAYSSNKDSEYHIYTMNSKGENEFKVTNDKPVASYHNSGGGFVWSPTGDQILYGHYGDLYTINYNGTGENKIASAPVNRHFGNCEWSAHFNNASQEKLAVLTQGEKPYDNEIYLMDPDGSNLFLLVDNLEGTISNPQISPDGTKVIFSLDSLFEDDNGRQLSAKIYSVNVDGTNVVNLSGDDKPDGTNDLQARYTETGNKIVFLNIANDNEGVRSIWTMDLDGSNREKIIDNAEMPDLYNP